MKFRHLVAACLMFAASLSTAQAEEHTFSLPSDETMALLAQYGQDIATFSVKSDMSGITLAIPNAKVRLWGGPVGKVRNLVIGVPPSAYGEIKFGDPAVALDGGIMLDVGAAMLYMPAVYSGFNGGFTNFITRVSIPTHKLEFLRFEIVP